MAHPIVTQVTHALETAVPFLEGMGTSGGDVVHEGEGFGGTTTDTELRADDALGKHLTEVMLEIPDIGVVLCEGREPVQREGGRYLVAIDPLDGSLDYRQRGPTIGLPYSATVAVFDGLMPTFADCLVAGTIDLRSADIWVAERGRGCKVNEEVARTSGATTVDLKHRIGIAEFYYAGHRPLVLGMFDGESGYLRSIGSAAYEMALVASGGADFYVCDRQKCHELGAAFRLVVEAGGAVIDHDGEDLGSRPYRFGDQVPVIVAATDALAQELLRRVRMLRP